MDRVTIVVPPDVGWGFQTATWDAALLALHGPARSRPVVDPRDEELEIMWPLPSDGQQGIPFAEAVQDLPLYQPPGSSQPQSD